MKIYKRCHFLNLPEGTFFSRGYEWIIQGFYIKGETWKDDSGKNIDFLLLDLVNIEAFDTEELFKRLEDMKEKCLDYPINESYQRDGVFDDTELFLVYEKQDLIFIKKNIDRFLCL